MKCRLCQRFSDFQLFLDARWGGQLRLGVGVKLKGTKGDNFAVVVQNNVFVSDADAAYAKALALNIDPG